MTISCAATAQHNRHYNYSPRYYKPQNNWIAPAIIGSVIGGAIIYGATRPQYYAPPPPVVYAPQNPVPPYGFHYENIVDSACNCVRTILVPN